MRNLEPVEPSPRLDASRPTFLRLAGFVLTVAGALVAGLGSLTTWVTVGIRDVPIDSVFRGTDIPDGRIVLASAIAMLGAVLVSRLLRTPAARKAAAAVVIAGGVLCVGMAGAFVVTATSRFEPANSEALADALDVTEAELMAMLDAEGVLGFTEVGAGPYLALLGGVLGVLGGVLVLAWASRTDATEPIRESPQTLTAMF